MKQYIVAFLIALNSINALNGIDSCHFKLGGYISKLLYGQLPKTVKALYEFDSLRDKSGRAYGICDAHEFDPEALASHTNGKSYSKYVNLQNRCSSSQNAWWVSNKDAALLKYARIMAMHEKEWNAWCRRRCIALEVNVDTPEGKKVETIRYREDVHSPFFKRGIITSDIEKKYKGTLTLDVVNAFENQAYHDELQFLQTQQHKMEMYWSIKSASLEWNSLKSEWSSLKWYQKILYRSKYDAQRKEYNECCESYNKQQKLLKQEIEKFKDDKYREAFTRSCMQKNNFELVRDMRQEYKISREKE